MGSGKRVGRPGARGAGQDVTIITDWAWAGSEGTAEPSLACW